MTSSNTRATSGALPVDPALAVVSDPPATDAAPARRVSAAASSAAHTTRKVTEPAVAASTGADTHQEAAAESKPTKKAPTKGRSKGKAVKSVPIPAETEPTTADLAAALEVDPAELEADIPTVEGTVDVAVVAALDPTLAAVALATPAVADEDEDDDEDDEEGTKAKSEDDAVAMILTAMKRSSGWR